MKSFDKSRRHLARRPQSDKGTRTTRRRFVLIISPKEFNHQFGTPLCVPITLGGSLARHAGFAATLTGTGIKTDGVVLCNQLRIVDLAARNAKFIERVPDYVVLDVIAKVMTLLE